VIVVFVGCAESRELPTAPSINADHVAAKRSLEPGPQGYPFAGVRSDQGPGLAVGGFNRGRGVDLRSDGRSVTRSAEVDAGSQRVGADELGCVALDVQSRKLILYQGYKRRVRRGMSNVGL